MHITISVWVQISSRESCQYVFIRITSYSFVNANLLNVPRNIYTYVLQEIIFETVILPQYR